MCYIEKMLSENFMNVVFDYMIKCFRCYYENMIEYYIGYLLFSFSYVMFGKY